MTSTPWAASPLSIDQDETLDQIERAMTVRLIATLENLTTTTPDAPVDEALAIANQYSFDYLPVRRPQDGQIVGIFSCDSFLNGPKVEEVYTRLGPDDLISAETSLLHFVWTADKQPRRLVLVGTKIEGIVTLSDIQKLPVRMALFSLFIHFELLLTEQLRQMLATSDPLAFLPAHRAEHVATKWQEFSKNNMDQDILSAMDLCDKREVAKRLKVLGKSATSIETSITEIERHLRNPIAHGAEYAKTRKAAEKTIRAARATRDWIDELRHAR